MRLIVVHNWNAGARQHNGSSLRELLASFGHEVEYFSSKEADWRAAIDASVDIVVAAGGDGTVELVAREVAGLPVRVAVLPMGTANNISTALGAGDDTLEDLVAGWHDGATRPFDVGVACGPWGTSRFLESVGAGLLAETIYGVSEGLIPHVKDIDDVPQRLEAGVDQVRRVLDGLAARPVHLTIDGEDRSGEYLLVEALNAGAAGPGLWFAPGADPGDGLLDVVVAGERHRDMLADHLQLYRLAPHRAPALPVFRGARVTLAGGGLRLHVDDRLERSDADAGGGEEIELTVEQGALNFIVPRRVAGSARP